MIALAVAGILYALGANTPLHRLAYLALPAMEKARTPVRAVYLASFAIASLSAWGAHILLNRKASRRSVLAILASVVAALGVFGASFGEGRVDYLWKALVAAAVLVILSRFNLPRLLAGASLLAIVVLETSTVTSLRMAPFTSASSVCATSLFGHRELVARLNQEPDLGRISVNWNELMTNLGDLHGFQQLQSFVPGVPANVLRLELHTPQTQALLGVTHHVGRSPASGGEVLLERLPQGIGLFRTPEALPPAWIVHRTVPVRDDSELRRWIEQEELRAAAPVAGAIPQLEQCSVPESVTLSRPDTDTILLDASLGCRGMIVVADVHYPGWNAYLGGARAEVYEVYGALRGVVTPAGRSHIVLRYEPAPVRIGLAITTAALLACLVMLWEFRNTSVQPY
jgi:hypothetical protein